MADVILFPRKNEESEETPEIDLLTAVDAAIRDLRDIAGRCDDAREQAEECRRMLEVAFKAALCGG